MVVDYCREIEADLQRVYGVRLTDLGRGLTYRRLGVLLSGIPNEGSLLARSLAKDAPASSSDPIDRSAWTLDQQLLGMIASTLAAANWQRGGGKGPKPDLFGEDRKPSSVLGKTSLTEEQVRANLARLAPPRRD